MNNIEAISCRGVVVHVEAQHSISGGSDFFIKARVSNRSGHNLDSELPYPIHLSYHWLEPHTNIPVLFEGTRTPLGPVLLNQEERDYSLRIGPPPRPGTWKLRVTAVQEWVQWFDDVEIGVFSDCLVNVLPLKAENGADHPSVVRLNGDSDYVVLIGCLNSNGPGGLYSWNGANLEWIDPLATSSLTVRGDRLFRLLGSNPNDDAILVSYRIDGMEWFRRLPGHGDSHFLAEHQGHLLCVSTSTNSIIWLDENGNQVREWKAPGQGDAYHLNSVFVEGDRVFVSAFGRFASHREWSGRVKNMGVVFELDTNIDVLNGLSAPHNPTAVDGTWVVCNSETGELLIFDRYTKELLSSLALGGWSRGIAVTDDYILVGTSAHRHLPDCGAEQSSLVIVDRFRHVVVDRVPVPEFEIGDLCIVRPELKESCKIGLQFLGEIFYRWPGVDRSSAKEEDFALTAP